MKFCYMDESGAGGEPVLVVAAIVADASRMHLTKETWGALFAELSDRVRRNVSEFKAAEFEAGNGVWRDLDGPERAAASETILRWLVSRHHKLALGAVRKDRWAPDPELAELEDDWCAAAAHVVMQLQRVHQGEERPKGNTILIADRQRHEQQLTDLVLHPPVWAGTYCGATGAQLDQIVDVPMFADSQQVLLIQVADLVAYTIRNYAELCDGLRTEAYAGERLAYETRIDILKPALLGRQHRWPRTNVTTAHRFFADRAPDCLRDL